MRRPGQQADGDPAWRDVPVAEAVDVAAITKVYRGTHLPSPAIKQYRAKRVAVTTKSPLRVEADGELLGYTPATFSVLESALKIKV